MKPLPRRSLPSVAECLSDFAASSYHYRVRLIRQARACLPVIEKEIFEGAVDHLGRVASAPGDLARMKRILAGYRKTDPAAFADPLSFPGSLAS